MARVTLDRADFMLVCDSSTRVVIESLNGTRAYDRDQTALRFDGDEALTSFRGEGNARTYALTARFAGEDQGSMQALLDLFERAHHAPDGRILFRTHWGVHGLRNLAEVVEVSGVSEARAGGLAWDVNFQARTVQYTWPLCSS